jgi:hypothetical protein
MLYEGGEGTWSSITESCPEAGPVPLAQLVPRPQCDDAVDEDRQHQRHEVVEVLRVAPHEWVVWHRCNKKGMGGLYGNRFP